MKVPDYVNASNNVLLTIQITEELRWRLRMQVAKDNTTIKDVLTNYIKKYVEEEG